jgi:endopeptidase La
MYSDVMSPQEGSQDFISFPNEPGAITDGQAAIIQSAIRRFFANEFYGKTKTDSIALFIDDRAEKLIKDVSKTAERVESNWERSIINQTAQGTAMQSLMKISTDTKALRKDIRQKKGVKLSSKQSVNSFCDEVLKRIVISELDFCDTLKKVGFPSLKKALDFFTDGNWKIEFSREALKMIQQYDMLFKPSEVSYYKETITTQDDSVVLTTKRGERLVINKAEFSSDLPVLKRISAPNSYSHIEAIQGAELHFAGKIDDNEYCYLIVKGVFIKDPLNISHSCEMVKRKLEEVEIELLDCFDVPDSFINNYIQQYPIRELLLKSAVEITQDLRSGYKEAKNATLESIRVFSDKFEHYPAVQKMSMMANLLMMDDIKPAINMYYLCIRENPELKQMLMSTLHYSLQKKLNILLDDYEKSIVKFSNKKFKDVSLEDRIHMSKMDDETKEKAFDKLKIITDKGNEADKAEKYLLGLLKIPFGIFTPEPVSKKSSHEDIKNHLKNVESSLDAAVFGQEKSKKAIMEWLAQRISNGESKGECIALEGPPGTGKTTFAREGIAKALGRPFAFISMGGIRDGSDLLGHGYTYIGSVWGRIVQILMEAGCMDPVIYFDEVDKISEHGKNEIEGILTALTDFSQNKDFQDKYFSGVKFDLSRVLFVFSYNDQKKLNPIFKDRMQIIKVDPLSLKDKLEVAHKHLIPEILKSCGFTKEDIEISDDDIKYIIENYTFEAGARKLKENLYSIVRQINLKRLYDPGSIQLPYKIDRKAIVEFRDEPLEDFPKIASEPLVGTVNGLYATTAGIGGITVVQAYRTLAKEPLELILTGSQGDVMKESMKVARTVALNVIPESRQEKIQNTFLNGLHIHCPEGSTPKDGPSAGGAITTAIVSQLTGIPIRNDVAMTGEIDLRGRISKIGGLGAKLQGAKKAGVKLALIPKENEKDLEKITKKFPELIDDTFQVKSVQTIKEILDIALVTKL